MESALTLLVIAVVTVGILLRRSWKKTRDTRRIADESYKRALESYERMRESTDAMSFLLSREIRTPPPPDPPPKHRKVTYLAAVRQRAKVIAALAGAGISAAVAWLSTPHRAVAATGTAAVAGLATVMILNVPASPDSGRPLAEPGASLTGEATSASTVPTPSARPATPAAPPIPAADGRITTPPAGSGPVEEPSVPQSSLPSRSKLPEPSPPSSTPPKTSQPPPSTLPPPETPQPPPSEPTPPPEQTPPPPRDDHSRDCLVRAQLGPVLDLCLG